MRIKFNVFANSDGSSPAATQAGVDAQMAQLNADFGPSRIQWVATTQFINDTTYRQFADAEEFAMKSAYADAPATQLNVYVVNIQAGYLGVGTFAWDPDATGTQGGLIIDDNWFGAGQKTLTHEVGHCVGLWHTHHGVSEVALCSVCWERADGFEGDITGDFAADTAPTPTNFFCSPPGGTDSCSATAWGATDPQNYMGYADDFCYTEFSPQQWGRGHCWSNDRLSGWVDGCTISADCDDGRACNGAETCVGGTCQAGTPINCDDGIACTVDSCVDPLGTCNNTPDNGACNDGNACTTDTCNVPGGCSNTPITPCCGNGTCEVGEDCNTCSADCFSGGGGGPAACGNGICESFDRENCKRCPQDCAGDEAGPFCCGDMGDGDNPVPCSDPRCTEAGFQCIDAPASASCCGDAICEGSEDNTNCAVDCGPPAVCGDAFCDPGEDQCNCAVDCGTPPATEVPNVTCTDGLDNDCDSFTDCNDGDCSTDPACVVPFCGDANCDPGEDQCNCAVDCGNPPATETNCSDGIDNDCDSFTDCDDGDCSTDPACVCLPKKAFCTADDQCCSGVCRLDKNECR